MKDSIYVSVAKIKQDAAVMYAVDLYCNNIYTIDLEKNHVEVIGELAADEEQEYSIFDFHICDEKMVMQPRNGQYLHTFDLETKKDAIYNLREESTDIEDVYNCFSICYENKLYMFNRRNGQVFSYDYLNNYKKKIETDKCFENMEITHGFWDQECIYMYCRTLNKIVIYSAIDNKITAIALPDEMRGIVNVYKIEQYIVAYHHNSRCVYLINENGEIIKKYNTMFSESQIEPYVCRLGEEIYIFGNTKGELYKINLEKDNVETQVLHEVCDMDIAYKGETDKYIYCLQMSKTYKESLDKCIKIDKKTLEVTISELKFDKLTSKKDIRLKYDKTISKTLDKNKVHIETDVINLLRFLKYDNGEKSVF